MNGAPAPAFAIRSILPSRGCHHISYRRNERDKPFEQLERYSATADDLNEIVKTSEELLKSPSEIRSLVYWTHKSITLWQGYVLNETSQSVNHPVRLSNIHFHLLDLKMSRDDAIEHSQISENLLESEIPANEHEFNEFCFDLELYNLNDDLDQLSSRAASFNAMLHSTTTQLRDALQIGEALSILFDEYQRLALCGWLMSFGFRLEHDGPLRSARSEWTVLYPTSRNFTPCANGRVLEKLIVLVARRM